MSVRSKFQLRSRSGYILVVVMGIALACLFLVQGLLIWSQQSSILSNRSRMRSLEVSMAAGMNQRLLKVLGAAPNAEQTGTLTYTQAGTSFSSNVRWGEDSVSRPVPGQFNDGKKLFSSDSQEASYFDSKDNSSDGAPVPQWHHLARQHLPGGNIYLTMVSNSYPWVAAAPWGKVTVDGRVGSFNNAHYKENSVVDSVGVPFKIQARDDIEVVGSTGCGTLESAGGKISQGARSLAVPYTGRPIRPGVVTQLTDQLTKSDGIFESLKSGTLNKTTFISGTFLTPQSLWKLFTGNGKVSMFFSLRQACSFPFLIYPGYQNFNGWDVLLFHHPFPVDLLGKAETLEGMTKLVENFYKIYKAAGKALEDAWKGVVSAGAGLWNGASGAFSWATGDKQAAKRKFKKAKKKYKQAQEDFKNAWSDLKNIFAPFLKILNTLGSLKPTPIPITKDQEKSIGYTGWAYAAVIGQVAESLDSWFKAILKSNRSNWNAALQSLYKEVRVVHFIDRMPWGGFRSDGGFQLAATWTVPSGRSLKFKKKNGPGDFEIIGDVWLQKGSTLYVDGNLYLRAPKAADEYSDNLKDPWGYNGGISPLRPTGTLYMEEGTSLVVTGDLFIEGTPEKGSVCVAGEYDLSSGINTAVLCLGDIRCPNGTRSGIVLDDLLKGLVTLGKVSKKDTIDAYAQNSLKPMFYVWGPQVAKVVGPFSHRTGWMAKYATTLVFIPELVEVGLQGPWPIPLAYNNCNRPIFTILTYLYKVELNFTLGDNLFTASPWWFFGPGVVPAMNKTDPNLYSSAVDKNLNSIPPAASSESLLSQVKSMAKEVLPGIADDAVYKGSQYIIGRMLKKAMGNYQDPCATAPALTTFKRAAAIQGYLQKAIIASFQSTNEDLIALHGELQAVSDSAGHDTPRELTGVLMYAGGQLTVGQSGTQQAAEANGFFLAQGDVVMWTERVIGAVASAAGDIRVSGDLLYYPYFTRAFLYEPQSAGSYSSGLKVPKYFQDLTNVFEDAAYVTIPKKGKALDFGPATAVITAQGYGKQ